MLILACREFSSLNNRFSITFHILFYPFLSEILLSFGSYRQACQGLLILCQLMVTSEGHDIKNKNKLIFGK